MSLREFISVLKKRGALTTIERAVHWKYEIGEMSREHKGALLFTNIVDYPGQSLFTGGMRNRELISLSLGINDLSGHSFFSRTLQQRLRTPVSPVEVCGRPVEENILSGEKVDLFSFAVPWWNRIDGGRFIGTWHVNVTKDPQTGVRNAGVYRMQVLDRNSASVSVSPDSHLGAHMASAEKASKPLQMAVALGVSELVVMAGAAALPAGIDEYLIAGALAQKPLEILKCKSVDLEVPAESEIVLEGVIKPGVRIKDGPYFDYAGVPSSNPHSFLFEVTSVMHRNNPVFRGTSVGVPGGEDHQLLSVLSEVGLVDFHGSRLKHIVQNALLKKRMYKLFQLSGRINRSV